MLFLDIEGHRQADGRLIFVTDARLHLDLHVRPLHADRVARDALRRGGLQHGAGLDVVDGPMPRARHLSPATSPSQSGPPRCVQVSSMA
jgi:hypothetical protein